LAEAGRTGGAAGEINTPGGGNSFGKKIPPLPAAESFTLAIYGGDGSKWCFMRRKKVLSNIGILLSIYHSKQLFVLSF